MKIKRYISMALLVAFIATTFLALPQSAEAVNIASNMSEEQLYSLLLEQPKEEFIQSVTNICSNGESSTLFVAAAAFNERGDISTNEKVEYAINKDNSVVLRHIALESYVQMRPTVIDEDIIALMGDAQENARLRSYAIATLATSMNISETELLLASAESDDAGLAFNSIKALEKVNPSCAVSIAAEIYDNYETESPARINIASKVLSRYFESEHISSKRMEDEIPITKEEYITKSQVIFNSTNNEEIRHAISDSVAAVSGNTKAMLAATPRAIGFQGYAAYRDGVGKVDDDVLNGFWHTAIIYGPETSMAYYIFAQATGVGATTEFVGYLGFMGEETNPKGYYRPKSTVLTAAQRDAVCEVAGDIANEHIEYQASSQIDYASISNSGGQYSVSDIVAIRCDGLVEFAYEYNGIRVFGEDDIWDITEKRIANFVEHSALRIYPKRQAENYMVRLGSL